MKLLKNKFFDIFSKKKTYEPYKMRTFFRVKDTEQPRFFLKIRIFSLFQQQNGLNLVFIRRSFSCFLPTTKNACSFHVVTM